MRPNACPRCQGSMTEGFVLTASPHNQYAASAWVEGAPQKSFWSGIKLGKKTRLSIQTWRCGRCGFLESYAKG